MNGCNFAHMFNVYLHESTITVITDHIAVPLRGSSGVICRVIPMKTVLNHGFDPSSAAANHTVFMTKATAAAPVWSCRLETQLKMQASISTGRVNSLPNY